MSSFKFIDLFAGIGGFRKAFDSAGGKCVMTVEIDKYARQTYAANYEIDHPFFMDVTKVNEDEDVPEHDVLLAGFPCQAFSRGGYEQGFKDSKGRGTLFFDVMRIAEAKKPKVIVLENVKNLLSHDKGNTFQVIKDCIENKLGYHLTYRVVNSAGDVPQKRERIYLVAFRDENDYDINNVYFPEVENGPKLSSILHNSEDLYEEAFLDKEGNVLDKFTLGEKTFQCLERHKQSHKNKGNGFGYSIVDKNDVARTMSARYHKDGSEILIKTNGDIPRKLTPREASRLMGFDKPNCSDFIIPVSNSQAYKQFGNSVVVPTIERIANSIKPYI